eukprot:TRINITY_DN2680_c0_g1_i1.p1 TRINITY_DN2680_c0_g1~~TRINITY_DN2680_c0_g1_i1.p1  ORF type:complete len:130 (-),score=41.99 TRINITY_DN2680_c0_g1_i1:641-976(-)
MANTLFSEGSSRLFEYFCVIGLSDKPPTDENCMPELGFEEDLFEPSQTTNSSVKKSPRGKSTDEFEKIPRGSNRRSKGSGLDFGKTILQKKEISINPFVFLLLLLLFLLKV